MNQKEYASKNQQLSLKDMLIYFNRNSATTMYNWRAKGILPEFRFDPSGHPYLFLWECEEVKKLRERRTRLRN